MFGVAVLQASMLDWRGSICHRYMCIFLYIYIYRSTMRCAKFGVAVLQAPMLDWGVSLPWVFVHCSISKTYFGVMNLQTSMLDRRGSVCHG